MTDAELTRIESAAQACLDGGQHEDVLRLVAEVRRLRQIPDVGGNAPTCAVCDAPKPQRPCTAEQLTRVLRAQRERLVAWEADEAKQAREFGEKALKDRAQLLDLVGLDVTVERLRHQRQQASRFDGLDEVCGCADCVRARGGQ